MKLTLPRSQFLLEATTGNVFLRIPLVGQAYVGLREGAVFGPQRVLWDGWRTVRSELETVA